MKKNNTVFVVWGIIVVVLIALLTFLGFVLKNRNKDYIELEDKLLDKAKQYVDNKFLYPEKKGDTVKITSAELIENEYLTDLKFEEDTCEGYVIVSYDGVYKYKAYIKCDNYKTKGY